MRTSAVDKAKCIAILDRIDEYIPLRGYVAPIQEVLQAKGLEFSNAQVLTTRNRRTYYLPIVEVMQELYDPKFKQADADKNLIKRQRLNMPQS